MARSKWFGLILLLCAALAAPKAQAADDWDGIRKELFGARTVSDVEASSLMLYGPNQAADGALVPVSVHMSTETAVRARSLTLVIDRNPAPVAATFNFGDAFRSNTNVGDRIIATRIRVDSFSKVRALIETVDGEIFMSAKFIAGAGGCSALPSKDPTEALASLGRMKVKLSSGGLHDPAWREGIVMLRHPNFTGMQMDPKAGGYTPARFVHLLEVRQGDGLIFSMTGGISISEDPNIRFTFASNSSAPLIVTGEDTEGTKFGARSDDTGS